MACYLRNGTESPKSAPCDHNALLQGHHTGCCNPGDLCLTNGLCRNPNVNDQTNYAWFFGCTDKTFTDPACGNYCDKVNRDMHQLAFQCPQADTWCCNRGAIPARADRINRTNTACCSVTELLFKAPAPSVYATASYATHSGISFSIATVISAASSSSTNGASLNSPASHFRPSPALAIGLSVGLGGGAVIVIALGWLLMRRRRRRNAEKTLAELSNDNQPGLTKQELELKGSNKHFELDNNGARFELYDKDKTFELPGMDKRFEIQDDGKSTEKRSHMEAVELPVTPSGK